MSDPRRFRASALRRYMSSIKAFGQAFKGYRYQASDMEQRLGAL